MSSGTPLSDQDIVSLIALGVTSQKSADNSVDNKSQDSSFKGAAAGALTQVPQIKKITKTVGVEIQVTNTYDDTKANVQRITISKKISDKVKASATRVSGGKSADEYTLQYNFTNSVSAIGRYEDRRPTENTQNLENANRDSQSIFGLDLEFKREFK